MKVIDLSHTIQEGMTVFPGSEQPIIFHKNHVENDGFAEKRLTLLTHTGTHIDAPCHILEGKKTLDQFEVEKFVGKALIIPCHDFANKEIPLDYIKQFEEKLNEVDFVILKSGWYHKWHSGEYFNAYPALSQESASYLMQFELKGIGMDMISVDTLSNSHLPNHRILLDNEVLIIENLTNLDKIESDIFMFQCLPLKVKDADGSPIRAVAIADF